MRDKNDKEMSKYLHDGCVNCALSLYVMLLIWLIRYDVHGWQEYMSMKLMVWRTCCVILSDYDMIDLFDINEQTIYDLDEWQMWTKLMIHMFVMNV